MRIAKRLCLITALILAAFGGGLAAQFLLTGVGGGSVLAGTVTSVTGTLNEILCSPTTGDVICKFTSDLVNVTHGGTGANLSATGGASQVLKQTSAGGVITVAQLACADLSNAAASCAADATAPANMVAGNFASGVGGTAGSSTATFLASGVVSVQTSAAGVGNGADTTDDTLFTYTLPSNALSANGKSIRVIAPGHWGSTADNKVAKLFFAGTSIVTSGTVTLNNKDFTIIADITRIDSTHVSCVVMYCSNGTATPTVTPNLAVSDLSSNTSIIKFTGASITTGAANDVLGYQMRVEFLN